MTSEEKRKKDLEAMKNSKPKRVQPDPFITNRTLFNPESGDLYITITDKNGRISRKVINLLSD
jgi:hypothetical protein